MDIPSEPSSPEKSSTAPTAFTSPTSRRNQRQERQEPSDESTSSRVDARIDLRQGFPFPLLPLPLLNNPIGLEIEESIDWPTARPVMLDILAKHDINEITMELVDRVPRFRANSSSFPEHLTCLVIASRNPNTNSWYLALKEIEENFESQLLNGFKVEFIDPELCKPQLTGPIGPYEAIVPLWPDLRPQILNQLSELDWFSLSVVHFGRHKDPFKNPVTIVIGAPETTSDTWDLLTHAIRGIVNQSGLDDVEVTILSAKYPLSTLDDIPDLNFSTSAFQSDIEPGSSFGPEGLIKSATLGGAVRLRDENGNTEDMVMSVFHPFRGIVGQEREANGLRLNMSSDINIVVPSKQDYNRELTRVDTRMQEATREKVKYQNQFEWTGDTKYQKTADTYTALLETYQADKQRIETFDSYAGPLRAYSGFQTGNNLHDWSLSGVPNRALKLNTLLPQTESRFRDVTYAPGGPKITYRCEQSPQPDDIVWKRGRTTGITVGKISRLRTDIGLSNSRGQKVYFTGWEITPMGAEPFIKAGDSGAWVIDLKGHWRGMAFAELTTGGGVMEDVEVLIQDVQRMTGCTLELP